MNEWKTFSDVLKNIPKNKYKALQKLRLPVRYLRGSIYNQELIGTVGQISIYNRFNFLRKKRRVKAFTYDVEVFIDEKTAGKLFVWVCGKNE